VEKNITNSLLEQVANAVNHKAPLHIFGGHSKSFYGNHIESEAINTAEHTGIIEYQPSELVVTVRSGTKLNELEAELKSNKQMLAFEPPQHNGNTTIGGVIACGMSGPRRVACGSARDFMLGTTLINGKAEKLKFGGQVMKNVAGYDASRLMVGAQGTLGLMLDMSLKVLPLSETETSLKISLGNNDATNNIRQWIKQGLPISASCHYQNTLYLRLSSTSSAVKQSHKTISNAHTCEEIDNNFWLDIKNQHHAFFNKSNLWRFSHRNAAELLNNYDEVMSEWNGALTWVNTCDDMHHFAKQHEANATRYSLNNNTKDIFQPLQPGLIKIHKNLKQAFDPENIFNSGRLYSEI